MGFSFRGHQTLVPHWGGGGIPSPVADFSANVVSGVAPLTVTFADLSTNDPTSWDWDFGDGSAHSTDQNPVHIYTYPGSYTVTLTATNSGGSDAKIKVAYITATYILQDEFTTAEAAPLTSPRNCEPGPGQWIVTDTANKLSISGGELVITASGGFDDNRLDLAESMPRSAGLAYVLRAKTTAGELYVGFYDINSSTTFPRQLAISITNNRARVRLNDTDYGAEIFRWQTLYHRMALIQRSVGGFVVVGGSDDEEFTTPLLAWPGIVGNASPLWLDAITTNAATSAVSYARLAQLPAPWNDDYGIATQRLAGARSAGDTFIHTADCFVEATITTRPSADQIEIRFRIQDAANYWQVTIDSSGNLDLDEVVGGSATQRGTSAGVVSNGNRIVILAAGSNIKVWQLNTIRIDYNSATNFQTATAGKLETLGTGGAVSNIVSWPRVLSGAAAAALGALGN